MSIKYMNRVWDSDDLKGGRLLLLLAIADHANDDGEAWPSQPHLAKKARLDVRQVRRVVESLAEAGYLKYERKIVEGKKRLVYRLFPTDVVREGGKTGYSDQADKMSGVDADKKSPQKRTKSPVYSGHFGPKRADISNGISSHARSESPINHKGNRIISSLDDDSAMWTKCLAELLPTLQGVAQSYLAGSCLEAAGDRDGKPFYRVVVEPRAAVGVDWLNKQVAHAICRKLSSILGKPVQIEIVAAEHEPQLEPTP